jgi:hypothetical protein
VVIPLNSNLSTGDFKARLNYSDGTNNVIPIDGVKCKLHGLTSFNTSLAGVESNIVLSYYPDLNEPAIETNNTNNNVISTVYTLQTELLHRDMSGYKVYICPVWHVATSTFTLKLYLTNLRYTMAIPLDDNDYVLKSQEPFSLYPNVGIQEIDIIVNLNLVLNESIPNDKFIQRVAIDLRYNNYAHWLIDYRLDLRHNILIKDIVYDRNHEPVKQKTIIKPQGEVITNSFVKINKYGYNTIAQRVDGQLDVSCNEDTMLGWLTRIYYSICPIFDISITDTPPTPTHFKLVYDNQESNNFSLSEWSTSKDSINGIPWTRNTTVMIQWLIIEHTVIKIIGISPLVII